MERFVGTGRALRTPYDNHHHTHRHHHHHHHHGRSNFINSSSTTYSESHNLPISATSSDSSLASELSDMSSTYNTAADGTRSTFQSTPTDPFNSTNGWTMRESIIDDMAISDRSSSLRGLSNGIYSESVQTDRGLTRNRPMETGPYSSRFMYESTSTESLLLDTNGRHNTPAYYSLAPIQTNSTSERDRGLCPNCRANLQEFTQCLCHSDEDRDDTMLASPMGAMVSRSHGLGDTQHTPTKRFFSSQAAHTGFPTLNDPSQTAYHDSVEPQGGRGFFNLRSDYFQTTDSLAVVNDEPTPMNGSLSPTPLELTGDIRTVNMPSFDQHPLRTWL